MELSKTYNFNDIEDKWIKYWQDHNLFHAQVSPKKKSFTVVIPPPNVTGILHMGHALNNTLQDILIRYKRMKGFETLWMPGTDHAGIATQNVVERELAKEGKKRHDIGREQFIGRLWDWKKTYGDTIIHQLKKLGASCDWPRTSFTMDDDYSLAVRKVFVELYQKDLIYQGHYIINWCPRCQTALSDEEAEHKDMKGHLWHIKYPLKNDPSQHIIVATTRPETMLGDTAVAVNPQDSRYQKLLGQELTLPLTNRTIKIIADDFVDQTFGSGAVKVTPAHDPNDFMMGQRHQLPSINVMHPDARINENGGTFEGMDRFEAREAIIDELTDLKLLAKTEEHLHAVGHCYRCHTVVEPYLSKQWFVRMKPLAEKAAAVVRSEEVTFYPERWTKVYLNWMDNIRDWCISRQIWWGHRIPVWYDEERNIYVSMSEEEARAQAKAKHGKAVKLEQDPDVLDTWFSSWLWPFATLKWPHSNKDLEYFYPGAALFTASEIIFFWVARMIMAGIEFMGNVPFTEVYIHGTVRDTQGRKMSKSLGNAIDPLEIIKEYGADALRFSLIINSGQDLYISKEKFEIGRNFANKIWNASRLILMNLEPDTKASLSQIKTRELDIPSRWIISRYYSTLKGVQEAIEHFRYSEAESLIYEFFWNNFCDWYLEIIKDKFDDKNIQRVVFCVLEESLKMIHPFMPFVTEELWSKWREGSSLCVTPWPEVQENLIDQPIEEDMQILTSLVSNIRNIRAQWRIANTEHLPCTIVAPDKKNASLIETNQDVLKRLARLNTIAIVPDSVDVKNAATALIGPLKCIIPLEGIIDIGQERKRIHLEIETQKKSAGNLAARLSNENFLSKAPEDVVQKEKERLDGLKAKIQELEAVAAQLQES